MAKQVGIFVDLSNLYYCLNNKNKGSKIDYEKYYNFCKDLGEIKIAFAYGSQVNSNALNFIHCLNKIGFITKYKEPKKYRNGKNIKLKADWDVGIAVDMIIYSDRLDLMILGSADGDMIPVVEYLKARGVEVVVLASGISKELSETVTEAIEIAPSLMENKNEATKNE